MKTALILSALLLGVGCTNSTPLGAGCVPYVLGNTIPVADAGADGAPACPENMPGPEAGVYMSGEPCLPYCGTIAMGCRLFPVCGGKTPVQGAICVGCE